MKGAFGNEGALRFLINADPLFARSCRLSLIGSDLHQQRFLAMRGFRKAPAQIDMADTE